MNAVSQSLETFIVCGPVLFYSGICLSLPVFLFRFLLKKKKKKKRQLKTELDESKISPFGEFLLLIPKFPTKDENVNVSA